MNLVSEKFDVSCPRFSSFASQFWGNCAGLDAPCLHPAVMCGLKVFCRRKTHKTTSTTGAEVPSSLSRRVSFSLQEIFRIIPSNYHELHLRRIGLHPLVEIKCEQSGAAVKHRGEWWHQSSEYDRQHQTAETCSEKERSAFRPPPRGRPAFLLFLPNHFFSDLKRPPRREAKHLQDRSTSPVPQINLQEQVDSEFL